MKYKIGQKVSPIIEPRLTMLVDVVQTPARYHCHWFWDGEVRDSWFGAKEIQPTQKTK